MTKYQNIKKNKLEVGSYIHDINDPQVREKLQKVILRHLKRWRLVLLLVIVPIWITVYYIDIIATSENVSVKVINKYSTENGKNGKNGKNRLVSYNVTFVTADGVRHTKETGNISIFELSLYEVVKAYYTKNNKLYNLSSILFNLIFVWGLSIFILTPAVLTVYNYYFRYEYAIETYGKYYRGKI